jgi:hypothetical protein
MSSRTLAAASGQAAAVLPALVSTIALAHPSLTHVFVDGGGFLGGVAHSLSHPRSCLGTFIEVWPQSRRDIEGDCRKISYQMAPD